jgi:1-phosphofructokinase family hexose kinase
MILCLTPNPAIDRTILLPNLVPGDVQRAEKVTVAAGGKGLNVARVIRTLGGDPLCMGFAGGHMGHSLADLAQDEGLNSVWTWVNTETRICIILVSAYDDATVINEPGMPVTSSDWKRLRRDMRRKVPAASSVCISGSLPPQSSATNFQGILEMLVKSGKQVWVDTSGIALTTAIACPGICIKVNGKEIGEALGFEVNEASSARRAFSMLEERGLNTCVITLGAQGALLANRDGKWHAQGPRVRPVSTVGSGDAFLGGLISALDRGAEWPTVLRDAVAAGTANTLSAGGGQFALHEFREIQKQVKIKADSL